MRTAKGQYGYLRRKAAGGRADAECPVCMAALGEERRPNTRTLTPEP